MSLDGLRQCLLCGEGVAWAPAAGGLPPHWAGPEGSWCPAPPPGRHTHAPGQHPAFFPPQPWGEVCLCDAWGTWHRHWPLDKFPVPGHNGGHEHT